MSGRTTTDEAVDTLRGYVLCETLARELDMELPACTTVYQTGYRGLTAQGQTWTEEHRLLENQIVKAQGSLPADRLPDVTYAPAWGDGEPHRHRRPCGFPPLLGRLFLIKIRFPFVLFHLDSSICILSAVFPP